MGGPHKAHIKRLGGVKRKRDGREKKKKGKNKRIARGRLYRVGRLCLYRGMPALVLGPVWIQTTRLGASLRQPHTAKGILIQLLVYHHAYMGKSPSPPSPSLPGAQLQNRDPYLIYMWFPPLSLSCPLISRQPKRHM